MRFGVLGCGFIGATHARLIEALPDDVRLVATADADPARAAELAEKHGATGVAGRDELLARDDVDAVSICLPSGMHAEAAVASLQAGKHVLVEKPIDITLAAADRIIAAERASGRTVSVISQRRFQTAAVRMHDAVTAGELGTITSGIVETTFWRPQSYYDSGGWRGTVAQDGGGALMNQGVHALDLLVWMLGEPIEATALSATLAHQDIEVEDTIAAAVRFAGGALGTVTATTAAYPGRSMRLLVNGDRGSALIESERLEYLHTLAAEGASGPIGAPQTGTADNQLTAEQIAGSTMDIDDAHLEQYRDFVAAARSGRPPRVGTADARRALALVLAIYESARGGGVPVGLT